MYTPLGSCGAVRAYPRGSVLARLTPCMSIAHALSHPVVCSGMAARDRIVVVRVFCPIQQTQIGVTDFRSPD